MTDTNTTASALPEAAPARGRWRDFVSRHLSEVVLTLLIVLMLAAISYPLSVFTVPSGHVGVLFSRFGGGTVTDFIYEEGIHAKLPWDFVYIYDARLQLVTERYDVLSRDGIQLDVEMGYRFRLEKTLAPYLHQRIGKDYVDVILNSEIGSKLRSVLARYTFEEIYSLNRNDLEQLIETDSIHDVERSLNIFDNDDADAADDANAEIKLLRIDDVRIKSIQLPQRITDAIERKQEQQQIAQEYTYRLERERLEAERKRIEAQGIQDFQSIVNQGISEEFLRWKGIEATLSLAESENGKIIVFGAPKTGLPIILGDMEANQPEETAPATPQQ